MGGCSVTDAPGNLQHLDWQDDGPDLPASEGCYPIHAPGPIACPSAWSQPRRRTRWGRVPLWVYTGIAVTAAAWAIVATTGCVAAPLEGGGAIVGIGIDGTPGTASGTAGAIGGVLNALGVPGASAIGGLAVTALGALGYKFGSHRGERRGWDEAATTYAPPPSRPMPPPNPNAQAGGD